MSIQKISLSIPKKVSFKARTVIQAPDTILSKEDKDRFVKMGKKIGSDKDYIEIRVSELQESDREPGVVYYNLSKRDIIQAKEGEYKSSVISSITYSKNDVLIENNAPEVMIEKFLNQEKEDVSRLK